MPKGFPQLPNGFPQLPNGFPQLPNGFPQLPNGFPQLPNGFVQGRTYIASFVEGSAADRNTAPGAFDFDISQFGLSSSLLTITANYSQDPPGTSLAETDRLLRQVEAIIRRTPELQSYSRRTGLGMGGDFAEQNTGDFFVRLKPFPRRPIHEVMADVRTQIQRTVPGLELELSQLMEDIIGDITGRPEPVVVNLFSDDVKVLQELAPK